jgi:hypothetical protein
LENVDQQQPKSLDSSVEQQHDSLDTVATATSSDCRREENVLKALERRYHLLYLRAFEVQCMFESLFEKRIASKEVEEFKQSSVDTSDEEPIAKVAKISNEASFTSCKSRESRSCEKVGPEFDADADSEGSENEMEFVTNNNIGSDCVDGALIIPVVKQPTPPKTPSPNASFETPKGTVIKRIRPKDFSKFHRSNRKSKNCAIFYFKHDDTDNDQINNGSNNVEYEAEKPLDSSEGSEEEIWEFSNSTSNDVSPLTPDKNESIDDCHPLVLSPDSKNDKLAEITQKEPQQQFKTNGNVSTSAIVSF